MEVRKIIITELEPAMDLHLRGLEDELKLYRQILPSRKSNPRGRAQLRQILNHMLQTRECEIFVAVENEEYLGYCLATKKIYPVEEPRICGCINGIYVKESARKKGIGKRLFGAAVDWFKSEEIHFVELFHMINDPRATAFWEKMGFKKVQYSCAKILS